MIENSGKVTDGVTEAWDLIKQNAAEQGSVAQEKLEEAYNSVRTWVESLDSPEAEAVEQALETIETYDDEGTIVESK